MTRDGDTAAILVTGGTGAVGSRLSERLARRYPNRVVVAARGRERVRALAERIGHGARGEEIDVHAAERTDAACEGAALIVNCVPLRPPFPLLRSAVRQGCAYTDVSPSLIGDALFALHDRARQSGARVIAGAGLAPCTSNFMARALFERLGAADRVDVTLQLHLGDEIGAAAVSSLFELAATSLPAVRAGKGEMFRPFRARRRFSMPSGGGWRTSWRAPFCDQLWIARSLGVPTAASWLVLEPRWVGPALASLAASGVLSLIASVRMSERLAAWLRYRKRAPHTQGDAVALIVEASSAGARGRFELLARGEAHATAAAASLVARALLDDPSIAPGVWLPDRAISAAWFLAELSRLGIALSGDSWPSAAA